MNKFLEYLDAKNKLVEKPREDMNYPGDNETSPPCEKGKTNPYKAKEEKPKENLADMGDEKAAKMPVINKKPSIVERVNAVKTIANNPESINSLVQEMKKAGTLWILANEMVEQNELYLTLATRMSESKVYTNRLNNAITEIQEAVAPAVHQKIDNDEDSEDEDSEVGDDDENLDSDESEDDDGDDDDLGDESDNGMDTEDVPETLYKKFLAKKMAKNQDA